METSKLKKFAQYARRSLIDQVGSKIKQVLAENSPARRENPKAIAELEQQIETYKEEQVIEKVAYIWFNRFCALRFMDVNRYNRIYVVSPVEGQVQPEILAEAKAGHIDEKLVEGEKRELIFDLLNGTTPSRDPQTEAYRLIIVAVSDDYHRIMPYLFQRIDDYTELLMPDDLLSENSILAYTREAMTPEACQSVEVIGWLYQFYISEKKDEVFDGLKKNKKITPENIPAATQLFTPHWIVRYLVENSLGRLWMLNNPESKVVEKMDYYIQPQEKEIDFLKINKPEEIKICDPACGSGHMLTYAYDLLYAIYLDANYDPIDIPKKILINNLYGIEIDERAAELAAFALSMKALKGNPFDDSNNRRRFFRNPIKPHICRIEKIEFTDENLDEYINFAGRDLFTADLRTTLKQFDEADNFGSLIRPELNNVDDVLATLEAQDVSGQLFLSETHSRVIKALKQADYLSSKYQVVVANPPYMGGKGMNGRLGAWAKDNYPHSKSDLFAMFIERGLELVPKYGYSAMVTMQSWMFLSSYESLRVKLMAQTEIESMAHMANLVMGIAFGTAATVWKVGGISNSTGAYCFIEYKDLGSDNKPKAFPPHNERNQKVSSQGWFYSASAADFKKIPGSPIAYWVSDNVRNIFLKSIPLGSLAKPRQGMATTNNGLFTRRWFEVTSTKVNYHAKNEEDAYQSGKKWFPYNKGGEYRKWYGNNEILVNFENKGKTICDYIDNTPGARVGSNGRVINRDKYYKPSITWSFVSSSYFGVRYSPKGFIFDVGGSSVFLDSNKIYKFTGFLCSKLSTLFLRIMNPTLNFQVGNVATLPIIEIEDSVRVETTVKKIISFARKDWDFYETSWDFSTLPLLNLDYRQRNLRGAYQKLRAHLQKMTLEMQRLEEDNNRIFIEAYGLQEELTPEVPLNEITLTCNPYYRYGGNKSEEELETLFLADTLKEFISYAVGCMFGRYSLLKKGLVLANQNETSDDYFKQVVAPDFMPDNDNVIPLIDFDGDWFEDDISERFKQFLRVTFGEESYNENLQFIEEAIGKDIKKFFLKDFYADHNKRYKKRPIYWMFSSPKGSFNALIYMHRYRSDTVSIILNDYLREFRTKLTARKENLEQTTISASASQKEKTQALKAIEKINKVLDEVNEYEHDVLYPLAGQKIEIDLDDGVKANYPKFGTALKKVAGLS